MLNKQKTINKKQVNTLLCTSILALSSFSCSENNSNSVANLDVTPIEVEQNNILGRDISRWPEINLPFKKDPVLEKRISDILTEMTLEQKVAQMIQPEIRDITIEDMRRYGFGSYLNGGGAFPYNNKHATPNDWIKLAEELYQASVDDSLDGSKIPTMWGTDAVHGHNNVIGATLFPHNIGLGAANNSALVEQIAKATATEVMVTGIDWVFAPTVAVVRDDRWGRSYEGYSEDPDIVREYSASVVRGLQGAVDKDFLGDHRVISTIKHFLGDGGTEKGVDQGNNLATEQELINIHAQGYVGGLTAGAQSVMASFNSWHGEKNHGNKYLMTDVLKDKLGFDGFVVGDWNGHGQIPGCTNENCSQTINAGLDIYMVPTDAWKPLLENTIAQVNSGEIPLARIDDAVSRILRVKIRAGLFEKPSPANRSISGKLELIGAKEHRDIARQAVRESLVLLKNNDQLLPLNPSQKILVAGDGADSIGKQSGGWSLTWQGTGNTNADFPGATSIYSGIEQVVSQAGGYLELAVDGDFEQKPDVAIVVFGEEPYAEGNGDLDNLEFQRGHKRDLVLLRKLQSQGIPVVSVFISGRPLWVNSELNASTAFVAAWLPGTEGDGIADVIFSKKNDDVNYDFNGKLSFSWPATAIQTVVNRHDEDYQPLLPYGFGLRYGDESTLANNLDETVIKGDEILTALAIFDRTPADTFLSRLITSEGDVKVSSSLLTHGALTLKTIDKDVQEDARKLTFDGSGSASYSISSSFSEDLRSYQEANSILYFDTMINQKPSKAVTLSMYCDSENMRSCEGKLDITSQLIALPENTWQTIAIDSQCFIDAGADMAGITTLFELSTEGKFIINIANIRLEPQREKVTHIPCP